MNQLRRLAIPFATALGLILLLPTGSFATAHVAGQSSCSGDGADFSISLGFDSTKLQPTATPASNTACVAGGNTVAFNASNLPSGWTWSVVFPQATLNNPVLQNNCKFGDGANQQSSCTVVTNPVGGDYYYTIIETDTNNNSYTLDPRVIIGHGGKPGSVKRHRKAASDKAAASAPQP